MVCKITNNPECKAGWIFLSFSASLKDPANLLPQKYVDIYIYVYIKYVYISSLNYNDL